MTPLIVPPPPPLPYPLPAVRHVFVRKAGTWYRWGTNDCSENASEVVAAAGGRGGRRTTYVLWAASRAARAGDWLLLGFRPGLGHVVAWVRGIGTLEAPHTGARVRWMHERPGGFIWRGLSGLSRLIAPRPDMRFEAPASFVTPAAFTAPFAPVVVVVNRRRSPRPPVLFPARLRPLPITA